MSRLIAVGAIVVACLVHGPAVAAGDAATILRQSAAAYAALHSYSDVGVVEKDLGDVGFDTAFVRPDRFRFAWKSGHPFILLRFETITAIVRADGPRVTTWRLVRHEAPEIRSDRSLSSAVAGATGVSAGSAHTIATLLMPRLWDDSDFGGSVLDLSSPRLLADETVDHVPCHHLGGLSRRGDPIELWLGVEDHLLRRFDTTHGDFHTSEIHRDVRVDAAIAPETFAANDVRR